MRTITKIFLHGLGLSLLASSLYAQAPAEAPKQEPLLPSTAPLTETFQLKAISNQLILEKTCPPPLQGIAVKDRRWGNTLEFGINVWTPQPLPADSQFFVRYTCDRPYPAP